MKKISNKKIRDDPERYINMDELVKLFVLCKKYGVETSYLKSLARIIGVESRTKFKLKHIELIKKFIRKKSNEETRKHVIQSRKR